MYGPDAELARGTKGRVSDRQLHTIGLAYFTVHKPNTRGPSPDYYSVRTWSRYEFPIFLRERRRKPGNSTPYLAPNRGPQPTRPQRNFTQRNCGIAQAPCYMLSTWPNLYILPFIKVSPYRSSASAHCRDLARLYWTTVSPHSHQAFFHSTGQ